jgi:geranylgeranyl pyrophosphate synthase
MSPDPDPLATYRAVVAEDIARLLAGVKFSHVEVLKQQLSLASHQKGHGQAAFGAAPLCLLTAEVLGGVVAQALPLATSLALLETMAAVFEDVAASEDETGDGLVATWGMPRSLNAADALFALAQQSFLRADEFRLEAASSALTSAARSLCQDLCAGRVDTSRLLPLAIAFGEIAAARSLETVPGPDEAVDGLPARIRALPISVEQKKRLQDAAVSLSTR